MRLGIYLVPRKSQRAEIWQVGRRPRYLKPEIRNSRRYKFEREIHFVVNFFEEELFMEDSKARSTTNFVTEVSGNKTYEPRGGNGSVRLA